MGEEAEDKLSSLPDHILVNEILARLEIRDIVATSVLSRRWRHLWTAVDCLIFRDYCSDDYYQPYIDTPLWLDVYAHILRQQTSPKLTVFDVSLNLESRCQLYHDSEESCFRELQRRGVEHIYFETYNNNRDDCLYPPISLFGTQSLVTLHLYCDGIVLRDVYYDAPPTINLPNLKTLILHTVQTFPRWFRTFFRSCPLLEYLDLSFDLISFHERQSDMEIFAPKLKTLYLQMKSLFDKRHESSCPKVIIDAPALIELDICDRTSCYYFVQKPTRLTKAFVEVTFSSKELESMQQMSKFLAGMSSVHELYLTLDDRGSFSEIGVVYPYLYSINYGRPLTMFRCVEYLEITLEYMPFGLWNDLLHSLHCFPNLTHLTLKKEGDSRVEEEPNDRSFGPNKLPVCLASKLKTIEVIFKDLLMITDELKLLAYILSSTNALEKLYVNVLCTCSESREAARDNEHKFCVSLFRLPLSSLTCEVEYKNWLGHIRTRRYYEKDDLYHVLDGYSLNLLFSDDNF